MRDLKNNKRNIKSLAVTTFLFVFMVFGSIGGCGGSSNNNGGNGGGNGGGGGGGNVTIVPGGTLSTTPMTMEYVAGGGERQSLDYYRINDIESPRPVLVYFHSGGWVIGSKENIEEIALDIAETGGFHLVSANYRLADESNDAWPEVVHDAKAVVRYLRQNAASLGIDPNAIIAIGESAGAHLAAMLATTDGVASLEGPANPGFSSEVVGGVLFYGPYDLNTIAGQGLEIALSCGPELNPLPVVALLGCELSLNPLDPLENCAQNDLDQASPVFHVDSGDKPAFIANGTADCFVPWKQSRDLRDALSAAGVPHEWILTQGGEHKANTLDVSAGDVIEFIEDNM